MKRLKYEEISGAIDYYINARASETREEAAVGRLLLEATSLRHPSVMAQAKGQPPAAGYLEQVFEEQGLKHGNGVIRLPSRASAVIEAPQYPADVPGADGVKHLSQLHRFSDLRTVNLLNFSTA